MNPRRLILMTAIVVLGAVPTALAVSADPFGPVEVADPTWRPGSFFSDASPFVGSDASGNVLLGTIHRDANSDDQFAVYERCGSGPVTWQRTVLTDVDDGIVPLGLRVAANGTAMAVWSVSGSGSTTHYSAVRPPGGAWGAPQPIMSDTGGAFVQFALGDNGDAVAVWEDSTAPVGLWASVRPAGGTWGAPDLISSIAGINHVAMSPTGQAVVAYKGPTPGFVFSRFRPVGGPWTAAVEVMRNAYQNTLDTLQVAFDGTGRTVAIADFREFDDTIRFNIGTNGAWGATDQTLDDDGAPPDPQYGWRRVQAIVRHPNGVVAAWTRWPTLSNQTMEIVVGRLNGATWDLKVFKLAGAVSSPRLAVNAAGEILVAGDYFHNNVDDIYASIAASLTAPWPDLTLVSPPGTPTQHYRDPFVVGGGPAFAVGWGVHGGNHRRTEVISTKSAGATCAGVPTPTPTATATATAVPTATATATVAATSAPNPLPLPAPTASPAPPASSPALAAFATLPPTTKCVRGKLTVRFKKPPAGYAVKSVTVKVNAKKVATLKGTKLNRPFYLRKLPKRRFTVAVSVALTDGKVLTQRRRYTPCK